MDPASVEETLQSVSEARAKARLAAYSGWFSPIAYGLMTIGVVALLVLARPRVDPIVVWLPAIAVAAALCWHRDRVSHRLGVPDAQWTVGLKVALTAIVVARLASETGSWQLVALSAPAVLTVHLAITARWFGDRVQLLASAGLFAAATALVVLRVPYGSALALALYGAVLVALGRRAASAVKGAQ